MVRDYITNVGQARGKYSLGSAYVWHKWLTLTGDLDFRNRLTDFYPGIEGSFVPVKETVEAFKKLTEGEYDHFPEQAFFMCGGLEDLERQARELMKND